MSKMKMLHWKSRRGMKELDFLFENYLYEHYETADVIHQAAFEELVTMQDPVITDYLFGRSEAPSAEVAHIIEVMRAFNATRLGD